jgi:hypothetical protein
MRREPKRMDRRKFIYAGLGAVIVIMGGVIAYLATKPAEVVEKVVTVEKPVEKTVVTTVSGTPTTIVKTEVKKETIISTVTTPATPTKPVEKRVIKYTNILNVQSVGAKIMSDLMVEKFNATHPTHKIDMSLDSYTLIINPVLLGQIKAGTQPLLFDGVTPWHGQYIVLDALLPLDEFVDRYPELKKDNWIIPLQQKALKPYEKYGGTIWGIPYAMITKSFFFARTDLLKEEGYSIEDLHKIKSLDDLAAIGKDLTKDRNGDGKIDQWGFELTGTRWDITDTIWQQWAISLDGELGKWFKDDWSDTYIDQWPWVKAMEAHIDFVYNKKISSPESVREPDEIVTNRLVEGSVALTQTEDLNVGAIRDTDRALAKRRQPQFLKTGKIQFAPGPKFKANNPFRHTSISLDFAILKRPDATKKDYEAAFEFIMTWLDPKAQIEAANYIGMLPASITAVEELLKKNKELKAKGDYSWQYLDAVWPYTKDESYYWPAFPAAVDVYYNITAGWGEKAWLRQVPVQEAMNNAAKEVRELIKKFGFAK